MTRTKTGALWLEVAAPGRRSTRTPLAMVAHAETSFRPLVALGDAILDQQKLDVRLRELAILRVAQLTPARYEWVHHVPLALAVGVSQDQIDALDRGDVDAPCLDDVERLVLRFTTEVLRDLRASDPTFAAMTQRFSPQEIVELLLTIGIDMALARVMESTDIDLEPSMTPPKSPGRPAPI